MSRVRARKDAIDEFAAAVEGRMRAVRSDAPSGENGHATGNGSRTRARRRLGQLLVEQGAVTAEQRDAALSRQTASGSRLGEILLANGHVTESALTQALADQH